MSGNDLPIQIVFSHRYRNGFVEMKMFPERMFFEIGWIALFVAGTELLDRCNSRCKFLGGVMDFQEIHNQLSA